MRVLQINSVCGYGSTGRIATDLYDTLKQEGHNCLIAYGRGTAPKGYQTIKIDSEWEVRLHGLKTRLTDREGFGSRKATERFIEKVKAYDPDVIHLHNLHGYFINIEVLFNYLKTVDKKVIWTLHDCWAFTGHCTYFDYVGCEKWKIGCEKCPQKSEYPKSILQDQSRSNYQDKRNAFTSLNENQMTIVTPSHWLAGLVKESYLSKYAVEVIHNGIDLEVFKPTPNNFREKYQCEDKTLVLGVANVWNRRKGLDTFMQLSKELPDKFQIILVGLNSKQKKALPDNIIKIERTNSTKELAEIYTAADVFVNPTLEDNFPTTNLESLACGTPVITYDTGGSPESLNGKNGRIIKKNNIKEVYKVIQKKTLTFSVNRSIEFNREKVFKKYIQQYKKSLAKK
ncbi:glycosyltransferase [Eubacterium sp. 1001713B170207_170306_E7]|uniref:glycosyltransferase n=1 Tax=Eubacterium sp. 1001713B170207_170306_E7 TaxID=2787097 RepID=UPI001896C291|nr:glycosyltransferase [Eubacterium sp. 1001713B170207_170306_E7]